MKPSIWVVGMKWKTLKLISQYITEPSNHQINICIETGAFIDCLKKCVCIDIAKAFDSADNRIWICLAVIYRIDLNQYKYM